MDIDHDNGLESFEDDDITVLSHNNSIITTPIESTSSRQPLSKYHDRIFINILFFSFYYSS
jgi:hypothetical protein